MLLQEVSGLQPCLDYRGLCCSYQVWSTGVCAAPGCVWTKRTCAAPEHFCQNEYFAPRHVRSTGAGAALGCVWSPGACSKTCLVFRSLCYVQLDVSGPQKPELPALGHVWSTLQLNLEKSSGRAGHNIHCPLKRAFSILRRLPK